jgi:hypothetical protein
MSRPEVICAYPITPQTHIVEALSAKVKAGELTAEFLNVESEFAAMSVAIGAYAAGARAYTATASQGLLFMCEAVYNASGLGLPIVMTVANRAIGAPINIWNDHSDSMSQRDSGWIQLFAETSTTAKAAGSARPSAPAAPSTCRPSPREAALMWVTPQRYAFTAVTSGARLPTGSAEVRVVRTRNPEPWPAARVS